MGFEFKISAPPLPPEPTAKVRQPAVKKYKYHDLFTEAKQFCMQHEGTTVELPIAYESKSAADRMAIDINNGQNQMFTDDYKDYTAISGPNGKSWSIWLKYH